MRYSTSWWLLLFLLFLFVVSMVICDIVDPEGTGPLTPPDFLMWLSWLGAAILMVGLLISTYRRYRFSIRGVAVLVYLLALSLFFIGIPCAAFVIDLVFITDDDSLLQPQIDEKLDETAEALEALSGEWGLGVSVVYYTLNAFIAFLALVIFIPVLMAAFLLLSPFAILYFLFMS